MRTEQGFSQIESSVDVSEKADPLNTLPRFSLSQNQLDKLLEYRAQGIQGESFQSIVSTDHTFLSGLEEKDKAAFLNAVALSKNPRDLIVFGLQNVLTSIIRKWLPSDPTREDELRQEGNLALLESVESYNSDADGNFFPFVYTSVKRAIGTSVFNSLYPNGIPQTTGLYVRKMIMLVENRKFQYERELNPSEIENLAKESMPENFVSSVLEAYAFVKNGFFSYDHPIGDTENSLDNITANPDMDIEQQVIGEIDKLPPQVITLVDIPGRKNLTPLQKRALELRYDLSGEGYHILDDIAEKTGSQRSNVNKALSGAKKILRENPTLKKLAEETSGASSEVVFQFYDRNQAREVFDQNVLELRNLRLTEKEIAERLESSDMNVRRSIRRLKNAGLTESKTQQRSPESMKSLTNIVAELYRENPNIGLYTAAKIAEERLGEPVTSDNVKYLKKRMTQDLDNTSLGEQSS